MIIITNNMLFKINFIGILLILLCVIVGNKTAPGRYCAYYEKDTVWSFGQIEGNTIQREGFWIFLDRWGDKKSLGAVGNFKDGRQNGWWIEYRYDSLQTKYNERYFVNDTIIGRGNFYDDKGNLELVQFYENGEIVAASEILLDDGKFYPSSASWSTFLTELITPENGKDHAVIINSWSNIIDKTVAGIAAVLLIVNVCFLFGKNCV